VNNLPHSKPLICKSTNPESLISFTTFYQALASHSPWARYLIIGDHPYNPELLKLFKLSNPKLAQFAYYD
jgi:hypothetical protein